MTENYCGDSARTGSAVDKPGSLDGSPLRPGRFGACLVVSAMAVLATAVLTFAVLLSDVTRSSGLAIFDLPRARELAGFRDPVSLGVMHVVTTAGSPIAMCGLAAVVCGYVAWRKRLVEPVVLGVLGTSGIAMLETATKYMVRRSRPPLALHAVPVDGYSFPSGHASLSAVVIPLCCALVCRWVVSGSWWRTALWLCSVIGVAAVGFSRVFLGAHYPTDVFAGWSLAGAWDAVMVLAVVLIPRPRPEGPVGPDVSRSSPRVAAQGSDSH